MTMYKRSNYLGTWALGRKAHMTQPQNLNTLSSMIFQVTSTSIWFRLYNNNNSNNNNK